MSQLDHFIHNPGFHHLAEEILEKLDDKSLANCRLVSESWQEFIDNSRYLILKQIQRAIYSKPMNEKLLKECKQSEKAFLGLIGKEFDCEGCKVVLDFFQKAWPKLYIDMDCEDLKSKVFQIACVTGHIDVLKVFVDHGLDINFMDEEKWTIPF